MHTAPSIIDLALHTAHSLTGAYPAHGSLPPRRGKIKRLHSADAGAGERSRLELAAFQYEMYRGNQQQFLEPHPGESDLEFEQRPYLRTLNVTRVIVDLLSGLYRLPVERKLDGGANEWREFLNSAWNAESLDTLLLSVDRLVRLQGTVAVQPLWDGQALRYRIHPAHKFAVIADPADHGKALAVITLGHSAHFDAHGNWRAPDFADVWTANEFVRVSGGKILNRQQHGYQRPPFAIFRDRHAIDAFWVEGRGRSLCHDNAVLNGRLSDLAQIVALQGFGVMEIVNPDPTQELKLGPGRAIAFRTGSDIPFGVNFKNPGAPIAELVDEIAESIRHILLAQRVPEQALSVSVTSNASGVAIHAANSPVIEDRAERAKLFSAGERELFAVTGAVASVHARLSLDALPSLRVNYAEIDLSRDLADKREHDQWLLERGLITPWQILYRDNPDGFVSVEEAKAVWLKQREELMALGMFRNESAVTT
ncbi:MAG: hypothetical protein L6Q71_06165 [Planctomycetes bacterium]|nr:hypothetical protein [Planctomycetota bacterium]NUQ35055.1 hypothetical protein [Planctomycetaceae bacterium]